MSTHHDLPPLSLADALAASTASHYPLAFQSAMAFVLPHEVEFDPGKWGDYNHVRTENVAGDPGGVTRYGVDRKAHPHTDVASLDLDDALKIYWQEWCEHGLDQLPDKLAIAAYDVWVNGGPVNQWLQESYNEHRGDGEELAEDGQLGPMSLAALAGCDVDAVLATFLAKRLARYQRLARQSPRLAQFLDGWTQRNADLAELLA